MQSGRLVTVRTNPATQFTAGLAQHAALTLNLAMPSGTAQAGPGYVDGALMAGGAGNARLKSLLIQSVQNLAWEVWLWGKDTFNASATDPTSNFPWGNVTLATADGKQIAASGLYTYYVAGLDIPYVDLDETGELHLMLVNRSATAKNADATGAIQLQMMFEPSLGW